jgi:hypothetical protein
MANAIVPWPGPVPEPGASNVMMVDAGLNKAVLLKFCTLLIASSAALVAGVLGVLAARAVCDSAGQAKKAEIRRKTRPNDEYLIGSVIQGIIADLR